ncbi:MAG: nicotinate-nucleotide adenylyltransferase [Gammaproteobacteria bacterium]|nr:MAG: nicotinate-nucleotide adenylyltransferase [Gammaproteobacteria bacterium]
MLGIFGGSFDPIHFGHIKSALALIERFDFEIIRFIPCQLSPHKKTVHASASHRWQMLNLVCSGSERFIADDRELKRKTPSYTIDTLQELREEYGKQQSLVLILGLDAFLSFCKWHRYKEILSLCHIVLMQRPGYSLPESSRDSSPDNLQRLGCEKEYYEQNNTNDFKILTNTPSGKIYTSDIEKIDISSTMIRGMISKGQQPKYLLPGNVWNYIRRNKLYK